MCTSTCMQRLGFLIHYLKKLLNYRLLATLKWRLQSTYIAICFQFCSDLSEIVYNLPRGVIALKTISSTDWILCMILQLNFIFPLCHAKHLNPLKLQRMQKSDKHCMTKGSGLNKLSNICVTQVQIWYYLLFKHIFTIRFGTFSGTFGWHCWVMHSLLLV